mgnify:CR=1 FL=1|jgi:hypothetical protein
MNSVNIVNIVLIFLLCAFVNIHIQHRLDVNTEEFYKTKKTYSRVYDIGFHFLPNMRHQEWLINIVPTIIIGMLLLSTNSQAIYDCIYYMIIVCIIRIVFINTTVLPKDKMCEVPQEVSFTHSVYGFCYDKIFSGHTANAVLTSLILLKYNIYTNIPVLLTLNVINMLLLVLTRAHYTIDTIIGALVATVITQHVPVVYI